jgi:hypothetical protein
MTGSIFSLSSGGALRGWKSFSASDDTILLLILLGGRMDDGTDGWIVGLVLGMKWNGRE